MARQRQRADDARRKEGDEHWGRLLVFKPRLLFLTCLFFTPCVSQNVYLHTDENGHVKKKVARTKRAAATARRRR